MIRSLPIKSLYVLALAEGEGVGTACEYFAKRLALAPWLARRARPSRILISGLPEKYGSSLDFFYLAEELGAAVTVVDERPAALAKLESSLAAAREQGWLTAVAPRLLPVASFAELTAAGEFDLVLSSEVLQRLDEAERRSYVGQLRRLSPALAFFAPNGDNPAHTNLSGLSGVTLNQLRALTPQPHAGVGYVDMPPFPPGVIRTEEQRRQSAVGAFEAAAMRGLAGYARLERFFPQVVRRRQAHIVYALCSE